eukprot:5428470-Pyramimonas_sp.AAC.1
MGPTEAQWNSAEPTANTDAPWSSTLTEFNGTQWGSMEPNGIPIESGVQCNPMEYNRVNFTKVSRALRPGGRSSTIPIK